MPVAGDLGLLSTDQRKYNEFPTETTQGESEQRETDLLTCKRTPIFSKTFITTVFVHVTE